MMQIKQPQDEQATSLVPVRWRPVVRAVVGLIVVGWLLLFFIAVPVRYQELSTICNSVHCPEVTLTSMEAAFLEYYSLSVEFFALLHVGKETLIVVISIIPIALILARRSNTWIGIFAALTLLSVNTNSATTMPALFRTFSSTGVLFESIHWAMLAIIPIFLALFPTGRFVPGWMRYFLPFSLLVYLFNHQTILLLTGNEALSAAMYRPWLLIAELIALVGVFSQVYRYHTISTRVEQQQTKYVLAAVIAFWMSTVIWTIAMDFQTLPSGPDRLFLKTFIVLPTLVFQAPFSVAIAFSIFRYRLWEIDILIRRTLIYGALTTFLLLVYFSSVLVLQFIVTRLTGQDSPLTLVISTLAIAALFNPMLNRIQGFIDRRFYRRRYDARLALDAFAASSRGLDDVDGLCERLLQVVSETVQPEHVSLWVMNREKRQS